MDQTITTFSILPYLIHNYYYLGDINLIIRFLPFSISNFHYYLLAIFS